MPDPFEDDDADYLALINEEDQYSLWPAFADVPPGWTVVHRGARQHCLDHIERAWVDLRPRRLVEAMRNNTD